MQSKYEAYSVLDAIMYVEITSVNLVSEPGQQAINLDIILIIWFIFCRRRKPNNNRKNAETSKYSSVSINILSYEDVIYKKYIRT
jgi:hypothetical protein